MLIESTSSLFWKFFIKDAPLRINSYLKIFSLPSYHILYPRLLQLRQGNPKYMGRKHAYIHANQCSLGSRCNHLLDILCQWYMKFEPHADPFKESVMLWMLQKPLIYWAFPLTFLCLISTYAIGGECFTYGVSIMNILLNYCLQDRLIVCS